MTDEVLLYLRLVMYPLAILALTIIIIIRIQEHENKSLTYGIVVSTLFILVVFLIELLLVYQPNLHELVQSVVLTPVITVLTIGAWAYLIRQSTKHFAQKLQKGCRND